MNERINPPSLKDQTQLQLDCLMSDCQESVPNLIGKIRETRTTNNHQIVPKGYKTKDIIGKEMADSWKE